MLLIFLVVDLRIPEIGDTLGPTDVDIKPSVANHFTDMALCSPEW
jgi:hypothetical protein